MKRDHKYYNDLIIRYFVGEADPEEIHSLGEWVGKDPSNRKLFDDSRKSWELIERDRLMRSMDIEQELNVVDRLIRQRQQIGELEWRSASGADDFKILPIDPERPVRRFNLMPLLRIAAILLVLLVPAWLIYRNFIEPVNERLTAGNSVVESVLPDGTVVSLNSGSALDYPAHFVKPLREVTLDGEGYFDVAHDASKPFVIANGSVRIKALGTAFNVNTRVTGDMMEVVLTRGRVAVYFDNRPELRVILEPGEKASLSVSRNTIIKSFNPDENYMSWKTRRINFSNQPLETVVATLNNVYHSNITVKPGNLQNCRLTATFDHQSLEAVLHVLTTTLELTARNNGSGIELSGKECN
jgi:ferric-dicitrate binding protein FerR (iron transport regulator)